VYGFFCFPVTSFAWIGITTLQTPFEWLPFWQFSGAISEFQEGLRQRRIACGLLIKASSSNLKR